MQRRPTPTEKEDAASQAATHKAELAATQTRRVKKRKAARMATEGNQDATEGSAPGAVLTEVVTISHHFLSPATSYTL